MTNPILSMLLDQIMIVLIFVNIILVGISIVAWPALQARKFIRNSVVYEEQVPVLWHSGLYSSQQKKSRPLLSVIIPAYNEERRLPSMLASTIDYLTDAHHELVGLCQEAIDISNSESHESKNASFELIIVDDGSNDSTIEAIQNLLSKKENSTNDIIIRILNLHRNSGKGAAIRTGMLDSSAHLCLMADADGATEISSGLPRLLRAIASGKNTMAFGSRAHLQQKSQVTRTMSRTILMHAFHFFVRALCSNYIQDTQCGFKLFTRSTAHSLFRNLHLTRWAFDTELVVIAERLGLGIAEVGVQWEEVDGSKLDNGGKLGLAITSLGMLRDMLCVRVCYGLGFWKLKKDSGRGKFD